MACLELDNLAELMILLVKYGFDFVVNTVTTDMFYDGQKITAVLSLVEYVGPEMRVLSKVQWVPGHEVLHDPNDDTGTCDMDAQEVIVWWLNEFKDIQVKYGEA